MISFVNDEGVETHGTTLRLSEAVAVLEVYDPYVVVRISAVLPKLTIYHGTTIAYEGRAIVKNLINTGLVLVISVTLTDPWLDQSAIQSEPKDLQRIAYDFISKWDKHNEIRPGYRLAMSNIRNFLVDLKKWLTQSNLQGDDPLDTLQNDVHLEDEKFQQLAKPLIERLTEMCGGFEREAALVTEDQTEIHVEFVKKDLIPLIMVSPFINRTYSKPLGHAGDYEMVNMMDRDQREGRSTYAQIINQYYLNMGLAKAHRNRLKILEERLIELANAHHANPETKDRPFRILNVGCGPAIEVTNFIHNSALSNSCTFDLLDFNYETLNVTEKSITATIKQVGSGPVMNYLHQSVTDLVRAASGKKRDVLNGPYDFIYCAGLFDYLGDKLCSRLIKLFHTLIADGGTVLVTNVHPDNPDRFAMEHIVDWYLIMRDAEQVAALALEFNNQKIYDDSTHLNVFLEITKESATV
ncbi:MAG: class I SAM-dependent methyltransferase [Kordiimonadaceae bacterium]|nr:class I SAM-dependent methyltransferase [Kordiimonadaceae bacterium]